MRLGLFIFDIYFFQGLRKILFCALLYGDMDKEQNNSLLHKFDQPEKKQIITFSLLAIFIGVIVLGVGSGYLLTFVSGKTANLSIKKSGSASAINKGDIFGTTDVKTFKDSTQGVLENGGIDGEGQFHLVRPGGISQNVYLTSSVVDLSKFEKRKIKVWGETQKAQKAGWLMDVGKVEVLE